jgi:small subunit ribosomal protein S13
MARISGVNIPDEKRIIIALTYVYGIGKTLSAKILNKAGIDLNVKTKDLTETELGKIREVITSDYIVEGDLSQRIRDSINRLKNIGSYRGTRHKQQLPARGQRTKTNARTKRGKRLTVGSGKNKAPAPK